jgi:hypothetical protein
MVDMSADFLELGMAVWALGVSCRRSSGVADGSFARILGPVSMEIEASAASL